MFKHLNLPFLDITFKELADERIDRNIFVQTDESNCQITLIKKIARKRGLIFMEKKFN